MYIVTGVSRGLGKAIVEELLGLNKAVIGIGRSHNFDNPNFTFLECDLSNPNSINKLVFPKLVGHVTLINNAGVLGKIKRISDQSSLDLDQVLTVNVLSPTSLLHRVYSKVENKNNFTLVNISSGAANRAIPSWAAYCASKAALNMLTETFYLEELEKENHPIVYAVAPGVIDTDMQLEIRSADVVNFSSLESFKELKDADKLFSPREASKRLIKLLDMPFTGQVHQDLRGVD